MKFLLLVVFLSLSAQAWEFSYDFSLDSTPNPTPHFSRRIEIDAQEGFLTYVSSGYSITHAMILASRNGELSTVVDLTRYLSVQQKSDCLGPKLSIGKTSASIYCYNVLYLFSRKDETFQLESSIKLKQHTGPDSELWNDEFYFTSSNGTYASTSILFYKKEMGTRKLATYLTSPNKIQSFKHLGLDRILLLVQSSSKKSSLQLLKRSGESWVIVKEAPLSNSFTDASIVMSKDMVVISNHEQNSAKWEVFRLSGDHLSFVQTIGLFSSSFGEEAKANLSGDDLILSFPRSRGKNDLRDSGELKTYRIQNGRYVFLKQINPDFWEKEELYFGDSLTLFEQKIYCLAPGFPNPEGSGELLTRILVYSPL